uniref:Uncharacterized protein MANES_11G164200 n=1 Tax=Rhizophora mucronata TaxID=61149 RepID=A0A2P2JBT7_RHIMU
MWSVGGISQKFFKSNLATRLLFSRGLASTLYVNGISFSSTEKTIAEAFSKYGEVSEVKLIMNKALNRPKGFGYVTFANEDEAQKALIDMNGKPLDGRIVFVDTARTRKEVRMRNGRKDPARFVAED